MSEEFINSWMDTNCLCEYVPKHAKKGLICISLSLWCLLQSHFSTISLKKQMKLLILQDKLLLDLDIKHLIIFSKILSAGSVVFTNCERTEAELLKHGPN